MDNKLIKQARSEFWKRNYSLAADLYKNCLDVYPQMWWLELEKIRCHRQEGFPDKLLISDSTNTQLIFTPDYQANNYQKIMYSDCEKNNIFFKGLNYHDVLLLFDDFFHNPGRIIFHQHWLGEIYKGKNNDELSIATTHHYFNCLQCLRAFGGKVIWTVHNLFDHDLSASEVELNKICLSRMCSASDIILIHFPDLLYDLESITGKKLSNKVKILKHPIYDSMEKVGAVMPHEIQNLPLLDNFIFLCFGMLRPYKGAMELIQCFLQQIESSKMQNSLLILAGKIYDQELNDFLKKNNEKIKARIAIINRRLSDQELAYLCCCASVAVLPYRNITTSGSYYQATTFALPSIVPEVGMFKTEVVDGHTGIKYSKQEELGTALLRAYKMGSKNLKIMGKQALDSCSGQEEENFSKEFYNLINSLLLENHNGSN